MKWDLVGQLSSISASRERQIHQTLSRYDVESGSKFNDYYSAPTECTVLPTYVIVRGEISGVSSAGTEDALLENEESHSISLPIHW